MRRAWDWEFFFEVIPTMLEGMWTTVQATLAGISVALVLGLFLALGRRSHIRPIRWAFRSFIEFVRSTPLLVQLFFLFFALPSLGVVMSAMTTLVVGLGIHYGTYTSEAYRAGIDAVPKGQWEAATALNLSTVTKWTQVILPQAIPTSLPALGNYFVAMFKDAPLGSTIGVLGVLGVADNLGSQFFRYLETMTFAGILFLAVSVPAAYFVRHLEHKYGYSR